MTDISQNTETKEEIRTLYVMGFPTDLIYREVYNLFRFSAGFERCTVNLQRQYPTVFVTFKSRDEAQAAMLSLQGLQFDPDVETSSLKIEWAKNNTTATKGGQIHRQGRGRMRKRSRVTSTAPPNMFGMGAASFGSLGEGGGSQVPPLSSGLPMPYTASRAPTAAPMAPLNTTGNVYMDQVAHGFGSALYPDPTRFSGRGPRGKPIQTLFLHGIDGAVEADLRAMMSQFPGFLQARCSRKNGLVAWVHFDSVEAATLAAQQLTGTFLPGMSGQGLIADYAKSPMTSGYGGNAQY